MLINNMSKMKIDLIDEVNDKVEKKKQHNWSLLLPLLL